MAKATNFRYTARKTAVKVENTFYAKILKPKSKQTFKGNLIRLLVKVKLTLLLKVHRKVAEGKEVISA